MSKHSLRKRVASRKNVANSHLQAVDIHLSGAVHPVHGLLLQHRVPPVAQLRHSCVAQAELALAAMFIDNNVRSEVASAAIEPLAASADCEQPCKWLIDVCKWAYGLQV